MIRPYKYVVQAVCQEVDDDGNVVAERPTEPVTVFGVEELARWAEAFLAKLAMTNGKPE